MAAQVGIAPIKQRGVATLGGTEKVAALLLAMGRQAAASVLQQFEPQEIRIVTKAAAELRPITAQELEAIVEEFAQQFSTGANILGTLGGLEAVLGDVLPAEQVSAIMSDLLGNSSRSVWDRVSSVSENSLASYLSKEHPQTAALILSKVKPACAAKVMSQLPSSLRNELMRRVLSLKPIADDAMRVLEKTLHEDLTLNFARNLGADTYARVADIINKMERGHIEDMLKSLSEKRPKSAEVLKELLFTFDDVINLTPKARTMIFDQVPTDRIVIALKGTDKQFRELILSSVASRVRRVVEHELAIGEPSNQRDVLEARRVITDLALELAEKGEIELNPEQEDELVFR
ncbi:flagellar motor switch protein FliG [Bradyrhizobium sp. NAS80.1]|uniref:flagellar motor switch protein FliG n=1 Tax=Bradyrhizobium sp. NAS80.1 TaxID=1680159 RepID=UPI00095A70E8|nr:flagellar motor switch protein FliG [Bradyrhizobium sp. NAS80.1]OKO74294.1 flagellar motor switch protein FliG [Bradyrhizobium sp. NAS80.1]